VAWRFARDARICELVQQSRRTSARLWYLAAALWEAAPILPQYIRGD
jgi:hypothetical protein